MFLLGQMAERFKAIVLKTIVVESHRGFESLSVRSLGSTKILWEGTFYQVFSSLKYRRFFLIIGIF